MTRPLPPRDLSINLLREIADGLERDGGDDESATGDGNISYEIDQENVGQRVASEIAGKGFQIRVGQRRKSLDDSDRITDQDRQPRRRPKGPGKK